MRWDRVFPLRVWPKKSGRGVGCCRGDAEPHEAVDGDREYGLRAMC